MRCVVRALAPAALLAVVGCSLFHDSDVHIAEITAIVAPDTVAANARFDVTFHVILGHGLYSLDHAEITYDEMSLAARVWSRDNNNHSGPVPTVVSERDITFEAEPLGQGQFRIIGHQPDGRDTLKTVTVLP